MSNTPDTSSIATAVRVCAPFPDEVDASSSRDGGSIRVPIHATINDYLASVAPIGSLDLALTAKLERFLRTIDEPSEAPLIRFTRQGDARGCWTFPAKASAKGEAGITLQLRKLARFIDGCDDESGTGEASESIDLFADPGSSLFADRHTDGHWEHGTRIGRFKRNLWLAIGTTFCSASLFGYVRSPSDGSPSHIWLGKRAAHKKLMPGKLDSTATGGLQAGISLSENMTREATEEADLPATLVKQRARYIGTLDRPVGNKGHWADYVHDIDLTDAFDGQRVVPRPLDGEVERFELCAITDITDDLTDPIRTQKYADWTVLQLAVFFIKHGLITPENEPHFDEITRRLTQKSRLSPAAHMT